MKKLQSVTTKKSPFLVLSLCITIFFLSNSLHAQIQVKGIIKGKMDADTEVLNGANIYLESKKVATISNRKGEFTFPKKLSIGDVLVFSYLGFEKKKIKINANSTFITVILDEDQNQMLGALNSNKRYKSKPSKKQ